MQVQADSIVSFLMDANLVKLLKQDKSYNLQLLQEQYNIGPPQIEALYHFAKNKFECGNYQDAAEFLYHYRQELLLIFPCFEDSQSMIVLISAGLRRVKTGPCIASHMLQAASSTY